MNEDEMYELYEALNLIKQTCENARKDRGGCCNMGCPLCEMTGVDSIGCRLETAGTPDKWSVTKPPELTWNVLEGRR